MPSQRRMRLIFYCVLAGVVTFLFFASKMRHERERVVPDFYHKTVEAMGPPKGGAPGSVRGGDVAPKASNGDPELVMGGNGRGADVDLDRDDLILAKKLQEQLRKAEEQQQQLPDKPKPKVMPSKGDDPEAIIGVGSAASGHHVDAGEKGEGVSKEAHEAEEELNAILHRAPIIIFSKSYCRFSKMAKDILLNSYEIDPAPFVVELDKHPLGKQLQEQLAGLTGRSTVPNVMIDGKSIGGGEDVAQLDDAGELAKTIKSLAARRIEVTKRTSKRG